MSEGAEKKQQDIPAYHLPFLQIQPGAPAWLRKGPEVISCQYQSSPERLVEEEFDMARQLKSTYHHDLKSGKTAKISEPIDYTIGGQITDGNARHMLAIFDRIDTQIATGMRVSQLPLGKDVQPFRIVAEDAYGFSVFMLQSENELNRIRQIRPEVALVETYDRSTGTVKAGQLIETTTGRSRSTTPEEAQFIMADSRSPAVVPPAMLADFFNVLLAEQKALQPVAAVQEARREPQAERITPMAAAREMLERFDHPKDDPAVKSAPSDKGPKPQGAQRKRPGPGR